MTPVVFGDHLRVMRERHLRRPSRGKGLDLRGAGAFLVMACAACMVVVALVAAFAQPLPLPAAPAGSIVAQNPEGGRK